MGFGCGPERSPYREFDLLRVRTLLLARAIYGKHMLLYLVIVIHRWQNWTGFYRYADRRAGEQSVVAQTLVLLSEYSK